MAVELRKLETLYQGHVTLMMATFTAGDGTSFKREIEHHGNSVAVLPYDPVRRTALMVSLPRGPVIWAGGPSELMEAVAGMIDGEEAPQAAVRREALEEAGVELHDLEPVGAAYPSPGVSSERAQLFLARYALRDRIAAGGGLANEHELITVMEVPLAELWARVEAHRVDDLKTLALILTLRVRRPELFDG
jgi:nudix-type nucleoside diphosphatase (YffH/AdpP family)